MLTVEHLEKEYVKAGERIRAVADVSFSASGGETVVIHGPSGSGKSTLLLMLGGMLKPTAGRVLFDGTDIFALSRLEWNRFRRQAVGFLFQKFYLVPYLSVYDNIAMPLRLRNMRYGVRNKVVEVAERLGVAQRLRHRPAELSVGEQQRVAMARTLVAEPALILADEPTGNLDRANGDIIARCFAQEAGKGRLVVLVTHDEALLQLGKRTLHIEAGKLTEDTQGAV